MGVHASEMAGQALLAKRINLTKASVWLSHHLKGVLGTPRSPPLALGTWGLAGGLCVSGSCRFWVQDLRRGFL